MTTHIDPRTLTDEQLTSELSKLNAEAHPLYVELEQMGDAAFYPERYRCGNYTPAAQAIHERIQPLARRIEYLGYEVKRREQEAANQQAWAAKDKRIAAAEVYQRRNGWEIVKDMSQYAVRHPVTKEEVYMGRLARCRQVADESRPE